MKQRGIAPILIVIILAALVGGYLVYQNQTKPTPAPQPTTQPSPTSISDPTASWKTYTNQTYNFSIKYPSNLSLSNELAPPYKRDSVTIASVLRLEFPNDPNCDEFCFEGITIYVVKNLPKNITIQQAIKRGYSGLGFYEAESIGFTEIIIGGIKGLLSTNSVPTALYAYDALVIKDRQLYSFRLSSRTDNTQYKQIFNQILSTFKFTN